MITVRALLEELFKELPYSKQTDEIRENAARALGEGYQEKISSGANALRAAGELLCRFDTAEKAAEAGGTDREHYLAAVQARHSHSGRELGRYFARVSAVSLLLALLLSLAICNSIQAIILPAPEYAIYVLAYIALSALLYRRYKRLCAEIAYEKICLSPSVKERLDVYSDRYMKRHLNCCLVLLAFAANFFTIFENRLLSTLNLEEFRGLAAVKLGELSLGLMLLLVSLFQVRAVLCALSPSRREAYRKYAHFVYKCCALFVPAVAIIFLAAGRVINNPFIVLYLAAALFIAVFALVNYRRRAELVIKNLRVNRKKLICLALAASIILGIGYMKRDVYVLEPYVSSIPRLEREYRRIEYDGQSGEYTIIAGEDDFRILQLTDIHLGGSAFSSFKDYKALEACRKLIEYAKPDLVVVTGDLVFPVGLFSLSFNNSAPVRQFAAFMRNLGVPWAFTFGNHDTEAMASANREEICALYEALSYNTSGTLLYPYVQPDIYGRSNQLIRIENPDGSLRQALFLIDSNDYYSPGLNEYDCIHDDQVCWYAERIGALRGEYGEQVSSMLFFHIPLQEYRTAYELLEQGSDEVRRYFGEIGETMISPICCSELPSALFDTAVELGSTRAMFCGHDHYNTISMEYMGIRLSYGMSIDYLAMPGIGRRTEQRGAELIYLHPDAGFEIEQIRLSDIE